jgi:hypothetical protein
MQQQHTEDLMKKGRGILIKISMVIFFMGVYGLIMNFIIYPIFIPDECYYHSHDTTNTVELLFDFPSYNGYHPVPSKLGYLLFSIFGLIAGSLLFRLPKSKENGITTVD